MTETVTLSDDQPLWTAEALRSRLTHRDEHVRGWALGRLTLLYPDVLPDLLPQALRDPSWHVFSEALEAYQVRPTAEAREVLRLRLRDKGLPRGIRATLEPLARGDSPEPAYLDEDDAGVLALASDPVRLRAMAPAALRGDDEENLLDVMMALRHRPERWAGALVLEHLDALLRRESAYDPWELLEEMGEVRAIEPGVRWYRPGERSLSTRLVFLAMLAGREAALPEAMTREATETTALERRFRDTTPPADLSGVWAGFDASLRLSLRCRRCHQAGEYDVKSASLDPKAMGATTKEWDGVVLGRIVVCKWCGAVDDYELTNTAQLTITSSLIPLLASDGKTAPSGLVSVQSLALWDGTLVRRPSQALAHLQRLTERRPTSGEAWRRLGNLRETYGQLDGAVDAWKEALARDANEAEACFSLAMFHDARHEPEVAFEYVRELFARQARQPGDWPLRVDMLVEALHVAVPHARARGRPLGLRVTMPGPSAEVAPTIDLRALHDVSLVGALFDRGQVPTTVLTDEVVAGELGPLKGLRTSTSPAIGGRMVPVRRAQAKVGRNDRCPCGSGKKFKKCCGQ